MTIKEAFLLTALVPVLAVGGERAAPAQTAQQALEAEPLCDPDLIDATFAFACLPENRPSRCISKTKAMRPAVFMDG